MATTTTTIKVKVMTIQNFKGIREREVFLRDGVNTISAPNGWGKTSIKNAFEWLLCQNVTDVLPMIDNKEIAGITTHVSATLTINDFDYVLERTSKGKYTQDGKKIGNEATYKIDGIDFKEKDYKEKLANLFGVGAFENLPIITDKEYFNTDTTKFKWTDRRKLLFQICGVDHATQSLIMQPQFANIRTYLAKGFATSDIKSTLTKAKRQYKDQQTKNNILIEQKLAENAEFEKTDFDKTEQEIKDLQEKHKQLLSQSNAEQQTEQLKNLKTQLLTYTQEKETLETQDLAKRTQLRRELQTLFNEAQNTKQMYEIEKDHLQTLLNQQRPPLKVGDTCQTCHHVQTQQDVANYKQETTSPTLKTDIDKSSEEVKNLVEKYNETKSKFDAKQKEIDNFQESPRIKELETAVKSTETALKSAKGQDLINLSAKEIYAIESQISALTKKMRDKEYLATNNSNIVLWKESNRALADKIVEIEKQEMELADYVKQQTEIVVKTVNSHFSNGVSWSLFNETYKGGEGGIEECCTLLYNGKRYTSLSTGEKNVANIETIKTLQDYYHVNIIIFSDNAESITLPLDYGGRQVVELRADKNA